MPATTEHAASTGPAAVVGETAGTDPAPAAPVPGEAPPDPPQPRPASSVPATPAAPAVAATTASTAAALSSDAAPKPTGMTAPAPAAQVTPSGRTPTAPSIFSPSSSGGMYSGLAALVAETEQAALRDGGLVIEGVDTDPRAVLMRRVLRSAVVFGVSGLYAASFFPAFGEGWPGRLATVVTAAAGVAWVGFGGLLLVVTKCRPSVGWWFDACLEAMLVGCVLLGSGAALNLIPMLAGDHAGRIPGEWLALHGGLLALANVAMGSRFVRRARQAGLTVPAALVLWVAGLGGPFAALMLQFRGWWQPG